MRELWVSCLLFCFAVTSAEPTRIRMVVKEDSEVVLNCSASGSVRDQVFDWKKDTDVEVFLYSRGSTYGSGLSGQSRQFAGRVAHFPEALDLGNASIKIKKAEVRDSGIYTCTFPRSAPVLRSEISLVVDCILKVRPPGEGASPKPHIRKIGETISRELWECEVEGAHPRPAVQWQDSSGRVLPALETKSEERDGRFYVTVRADVSRSGDYSCVVTQEEFCHQINSTTFVPIGQTPDAEPTRIRMVVKEDSEVVLNCSASGSVRDQVFDWQKDKNVEVFLYSQGSTYGSGLSGQSPQFAGRVAHFPEALDLGNASIKIKKAEVRDSGIYTCTVPRSSPVLRSEISLVVECIIKVRPPGEGACPEPLIRIFDGGPGWELLQCEVKGAHPRPAVQWQDSSGRVLPALETKSEERDGRFYVTVRAIVSRSGDYSCVVTQEEFCHQISSTTFVYICACPKPNIRTVDGGPDRALLECEVEGAHPRPAVQVQDSSGRVLPALETKSEERDGRFYVTVSAIVSRSDRYSCVVTQEELCHQISSTTFVPIGACPEPLIRIVDGGPDWALLECEVKGAHTRPAVQVQNSSGRVLPAQETESEERDGLFYVTVRANVSSSGNYSCVVTQEEFCHQINSTTFVPIECILKVRPPGEGASPEPLIRIVDGGPDRALLLCEVKGAHPRPAVQWQDSSGRVLPAQETESEERDGRFYVTVRANVSRSGDYSCVVTQEDVCHQISSTTFVPIGASPEPLIRIVDGGPDRALLQCEVKGAHPRPAVQWQDSSGRVLPAQETESEERDGRFYVTVRADVSRSDDYSCVVTQEEFCHQISSTTFVAIEPTRIRMVVKEDSEVVLNCSASGSVRDQVFDWKKDDDLEVFLYDRGSTYGSGLSGQSPQFAGRVAHFPKALDLGNASIRIKKAEVRDSGIYTCTFPRSSPDPRSEISLVVERILKVRPPENECRNPGKRCLSRTADPDR
ncbi:hemicentin-2-like [Takifugu flavidus]|uniref:hemicentin-2-like n=1 Tax=Takifugu flavidus TaxID=433684 RepID=UPI0025441B6D|nr:hemicentin-2-like [Takifugu flavidus]